MKEDQVTQGTGEQPRDGLMDQILRNLSSKLLFHGQKKIGRTEMYYWG